MGRHDYIIAVDMGTGSCRALLFDERLQVRAGHSVPLSLKRPNPGWVEQGADDVLAAVIASVRDVVKEAGIRAGDIAGVCFGAAVSSLLLVANDGEALTPAAIWADTRATGQARRLSGDPGSVLHHRTGCPIHATYLPSKLLWWRENNPAMLEKAARMASLKEYVIFRLCGVYVVDHSTACASGLLNSNSLDWEDLALAPAEIPKTKLSVPVPTTHRLKLSPDAARKLGLQAGLPVIVGATDGVLSNLGAGAVEPGQVVTMVGSSGAVRLTTRRAWVDPEGRTWCYPLIAEDRWVAGGANNSGGLVLDWVATWLLGLPETERPEKLARRAAQAPPGAGGLVFLPTIMGERSPLWDESARGILFGLSDQHSSKHVLRAAMEGIIYSLHSIYRVLVAGTESVREIRATGGYANSPGWLEIQASVFGRTISVPIQTEGSALGAAILGWVAVGRLDSIDEGAETIRIEAEYQPDPTHRQVYDRALAVHAELYTRLADLFAGVSSSG